MKPPVCVESVVIFSEVCVYYNFYVHVYKEFCRPVYVAMCMRIRRCAYTLTNNDILVKYTIIFI